MSTAISPTAVVYNTLSFVYTDVYTHTPVNLTPKAWNWNGLTTNGTLAFTGIPDWAVKAYVVFDRLSFNGAEDIIVQIGDSGGIETSGYTGTNDSWRTTPGPVAWNTAYASMAQVAANEQVSGILTLTRIRAYNEWAFSFTGGSNSVATLHVSGGSKTLSSELTQLRVTSVAGSVVFNNGTVAVLYE